MRASIWTLLAGVMLAGCTTVGPDAANPSFNVPAIPRVDPSALGGIPTLAPGGSTSGACALVSEAEMSSLIGQAMTVYTNSGTQCSWIAATVSPSVIIRHDSGETIASAKVITTNGRDLAISGYPAYYAEFAGSLLYIEKGGRVLVVQTVWSLTGDEGVQKVSQIGELALSRFQ